MFNPALAAVIAFSVTFFVICGLFLALFIGAAIRHAEASEKGSDDGAERPRICDCGFGLLACDSRCCSARPAPAPGAE